MRPHQILLEKQVPRLPSGKVDLHGVIDIAVQNQKITRTPFQLSATGSPRVQNAVARAWIRVLGRKSHAQGRTFEEAGGDSLKLVEFVHRLEAQLGSELPLDMVHGDLAPNDVVSLVERLSLAGPKDAKSDLPLVVLLPGGAIRDGAALARLRARCSSTLRFETVQIRNHWSEFVGAGDCFDNLVDALVSQIEAARPKGAIALAGYSLGGSMCFPVAEALRQRGRSISSIALIDAAGPSAKRGLYPGLRLTAKEILQNLRSKGWVATLHIEAGKILGDRPGFLRVVAPLGRVLFPDPHGLLATMLYARLWRRWCASKATEHKLDVRTFLFRSEDYVSEVDRGWSKHCTDLTVVPVSGDHFTMFEPPNLQELTFALTTAMTEPKTSRTGLRPKAGCDPLLVDRVEDQAVIGARPEVYH